jgi:hypothetical protein
VSSRAGLDAETGRKILCPCRGSNPGRPVRSQTLYSRNQYFCVYELVEPRGRNREGDVNLTSPPSPDDTSYSVERYDDCKRLVGRKVKGSAVSYL